MNRNILFICNIFSWVLRRTNTVKVILQLPALLLNCPPCIIHVPIRTLYSFAIINLAKNNYSYKEK